MGMPKLRVSIKMMSSIDCMNNKVGAYMLQDGYFNQKGMWCLMFSYIVYNKYTNK